MTISVFSSMRCPSCQTRKRSNTCVTEPMSATTRKGLRDMGTAIGQLTAALKRGEYIPGRVCETCSAGLALGKWPSIGRHWTQAQWDQVVATTTVYIIVPGHDHASERCYHAGRPCGMKCDCMRDGFSWAPCILCGTREAGARHDVMICDKGQEFPVGYIVSSG
jgi:hypothetical protein